MQHATFAVKTTATDQELGTFTALVSSWSADRVGDVIDRHAFDQSIEDWQASGKQMPLLYEHGHVAIGSLDPDTMVTDEQGLTVAGEVDRSTKEGKQVWAQIKRGSVGFSIGFMTVKSREREGGGSELQVIDLLEVSATSTPMHGATRVTSWKSATGVDDLTDEELRERSMAAAASAIAGTVPKRRMSEEDEALVERSRAEYRAARAAEAAAKQEEEEEEDGTAAPPAQLPTAQDDDRAHRRGLQGVASRRRTRHARADRGARAAATREGGGGARDRTGPRRGRRGGGASDQRLRSPRPSERSRDRRLMTAEERQTAKHESGHAAMALTLGLRVSEVRRWSPDRRASSA